MIHSIHSVKYFAVYRCLSVRKQALATYNSSFGRGIGSDSKQTINTRGVGSCILLSYTFTAGACLERIFTRSSAE